MQVSLSNDVKIYNLSAGKSLPEWISERKRRKLERQDVDIRRRIQLIQDFDMPDVSHAITVTNDGRYVFAAGTYKPFIKCYEVENLSLKFQRGLDADVIKIQMLSDDFSKYVLLEEERYVELHASNGRYFRLRIPKFGRDMAYCKEASDLFIVGSGHDIYRLNLEQGRFLEPFQSSAASLTCCTISDEHQLFICGTSDGRIEAWDHRDRKRVGILDCALGQIADGFDLDSFYGDIPQVTCVKFKDALNIAAGTSTGHVLMYDVRSSRPLFVKDHQTCLPIKQLEFVKEHDLVLSMDNRVIKFWNEDTGRPFAAIEPGTKLNDFVRYPDSGMLFFANESQKMLQYFVPAIGPAPKWCSYLENITEELEETAQPAVYDDYKFLTKAQLEEIGLGHLIGTNMLRAYMHGYFMDMRLYNKAVTLTQPFAYEKYKERKLKEKVDEERETKLIPKKEKLPKVNKALAAKLQIEASLAEKSKAKKAKDKLEAASGIMKDDRFKSLFENPDFEIDEESEQFKQLAPAFKKLEMKAKKKRKAEDSDDEEDEKTIHSGLFMDDERSESDEEESSDEDESTEEEETSDEDSEIEVEDLDHSQPRTSKFRDSHEEPEEDHVPKKPSLKKPKSFKFVELHSNQDFATLTPSSSAQDETMTLAQKRAAMKKGLGGDLIEEMPFEGKAITFTLKKSKGEQKKSEKEERQKKHIDERKQVRRSAGSIMRFTKPLSSIVSGRGGRGGHRGGRSGFKPRTPRS